MTVKTLTAYAAALIYKLRTIRLVEDAQKRTAYTVTATFLEKNGGEMRERGGAN